MLAEAYKAEQDPEKRAVIAKDMRDLESQIGRDAASLGVAEQALDNFVQQADRLDGILEKIKDQLDDIEGRVDDRVFDIQTRAESNEQKYFDKFEAGRDSRINAGKFDMGYDMYVRSKDPEDLTDDERLYLDREKIRLQGDFTEYRDKIDKRQRKQLQREMERRQRYGERRQLRADTQQFNKMISPLISIPRRYIAAHDKQGDIELRGAHRMEDLRGRTAERRTDIMTDPTLTLRQQYQQMTQLEREHARRRKEIERDVTESKKRAFNEVFESFGNLFRDMLVRETEYMAQSQLRDWWLGQRGWGQDGYGGYRRIDDSSGGGVFHLCLDFFHALRSLVHFRHRCLLLLLYCKFA